MSWKSTVRSLAAAQRQVEREAKRRQRELEKRRKELERMEEIEIARHEVEAYENYIDVLMSIHKDCGPAWNWYQVSRISPPGKPERKSSHELKARKALEEFEPGIIDKALRRVDTKVESLTEAITEAARQDEEDYQNALKEYEAALAEWEEQRELASRIQSGDPEAYVQAIDSVDPFSELSGLGSTVKFSCEDPKLMEVAFYPHGEDVIPKEVKYLLKSGRLSTKNMPKTKFYELYQDYVCACVLRVARELFGLLPLEMVIITAVSSLLNSKTGHMEDQPIMSVAIPRRTLASLNFEYLDPSDSLGNFVHNMHFRKTKGFAAVEKISPSSLQAK